MVLAINYTEDTLNTEQRRQLDLWETRDTVDQTTSTLYDWFGAGFWPVQIFGWTIGLAVHGSWGKTYRWRGNGCEPIYIRSWLRRPCRDQLSKSRNVINLSMQTNKRVRCAAFLLQPPPQQQQLLLLVMRGIDRCCMMRKVCNEQSEVTSTTPRRFLTNYRLTRHP